MRILLGVLFAWTDHRGSTRPELIRAIQIEVAVGCRRRRFDGAEHINPGQELEAESCHVRENWVQGLVDPDRLGAKISSHVLEGPASMYIKCLAARPARGGSERDEEKRQLLQQPML